MLTVKYPKLTLRKHFTGIQFRVCEVVAKIAKIRSMKMKNKKIANEPTYSKTSDLIAQDGNFDSLQMHSG